MFCIRSCIGPIYAMETNYRMYCNGWMYVCVSDLTTHCVSPVQNRVLCRASVTPLSLLSRSNRKKSSSTHILNPSRKLYSAVNVLAVPSMYTLALGQSVSPLLKRLTFMALLVCVSVVLSRSLSRLFVPVHPFNSAQSTFTVVHPHIFITYCTHYITPILLLRIKCTTNDRVRHPEEKERCSCC